MAGKTEQILIIFNHKTPWGQVNIDWCYYWFGDSQYP